MKKRIIVSTIGTVLVVGAVGAISALSSPQPTGADTSPVTTQLDTQSKELANHEARITNTEHNVTDLQNNAKTPPSTNQVVVPMQDTPVAPISAPAPVTVVSYKQIPLDDQGNVDCQLTYSDGTTYQWHWQTVNPQGAWVNGYGTNPGHWETTTQTTNKCDESTVGQVKD